MLSGSANGGCLVKCSGKRSAIVLRNHVECGTKLKPASNSLEPRTAWAPIFPPGSFARSLSTVRRNISNPSIFSQRLRGGRFVRSIGVLAMNDYDLTGELQGIEYFRRSAASALAHSFFRAQNLRRACRPPF
jgi:hypothetical protein